MLYFKTTAVNNEKITEYVRISQSFVCQVWAAKCDDDFWSDKQQNSM